MTDIDIVNTYWPKVDELDNVLVQDARRRAEIWLKQFDPDIDTRPNTPFGDLHLTNVARLLAAMEIAQGRFMSDLDLEKVAAGTIYNCEFVTRYLKNFAVYDKDTLSSSGVIRLVFCKDEDYTIDRRAQYQFGNDDVYNLRLPFSGHLEIKKVGSDVGVGSNIRVLTQIDEERYAVDVGVEGTMNDLVLANTAGTTDYPLTNLTSITALYDFDLGAPPSSLSKLAEKARETHYTASMSTPGGARNYLQREFPDLKGVSPVITGDTEMVRDISNPLGVGAGYLDVHVQSSKHALTDTQFLNLKYYNTQGSTSVERYIGELDLVENPQNIISIKSASDDTVYLGLGTDSVKIISESKDPANAPLAQAAYSTKEKLWITIEMPKAEGVNLLTNTINTSTGEESHKFEVTYQADPMIPIVTDDVGSRKVRPVNVNVLVRNMVPIVIKDLLITYVKRPGVTMALDAAREEIYQYFRSLGYPNLYSDSRVSDAMYYAGAEDVESIDCTAHVQWSVAKYFLKTPGSNSPEDSYADTMNNVVSASLITIDSSRGLIPTYVDPHLGTTDQSYVSVGPRNIGYIIDKDNIRFSEVLRS